MKKWISQFEKSLLKTPLFEVFQNHCQSSELENESPREHDFFVLNTKDWANLIPVTKEGKIVMVKQYRVGTREETLEFPGGVLDSRDPSPMKAAVRELEEETGYVPVENAKFLNLGWSYPNPAIQNNKCFSFAVGPVEKRSQQNLDPGEILECVEVAPDDLVKEIQEGRMTHALMLVTAFFLTRKTSQASGSLLSELKALSSV